MKAMIVSIGGSPEPIVKTLLEHKPSFVCFFASQQSIDLIGQVKESIKQGGLKIDNHIVICDDINDLVHCYEKAITCKDILDRQKVNAQDVVVDYTGGTKTMTAALTLATVGHGYRFSYVGGTERTKNGLGIVVSGTELIKTGVSPWQIFAVEEKKRISQFIASFQFEAAITVMQQCLNNLSPVDEEIWNGLIEILKGYRAWDNFEHKLAVRNLSQGLKVLSVCEKFTIAKPVCAYTSEVRENFAILEDMSRKTAFFKKLHPVLVADLVANAQRRALQNKYDDATARLYRALEMVGQISFEEKTGCLTSDVKIEKLPEHIRQEYINRYQSTEEQKIKIPLFAAFRALKEMNHQVGIKFFAYEDFLTKILSARNSSILAHGLEPVKNETYDKLNKIVQNLFISESLVEFPQLKW